MDRIRKALDVARQERDRAVPRPGDPGGPVQETAVERLLPLAVRYTKTKSYKPEQAVLESNRVIDPAGSTPAAAAYRMLRTQVLQRLTENRWQSLAIFSPCSDDGKTTTAINLAVSLANDHSHTVLLVDMDLKVPTVAKKLDIVPDKGIDDVLRGAAEIAECLYHPEGFERLVLLPARGPMRNSSDMLSGPRVRELVRELRDRYPERILVFDLPPILGSDDALAFAPLVECGLVIVAEGITQRTDLTRCMELLRKTPIVGTVLNRTADPSSGYG